MLSALTNNMAASQRGISANSAAPSFRVQDADSAYDTQRFENFSAFSTKAAKFLESRIPQFAGTEEENVELWIEKFENIAEAHRLPSAAMLFAATARLVKGARKWFDLSPGSISNSWSDFKLSIISHYKRRILFIAVMKKADERNGYSSRRVSKTTQWKK